MDETTNAASKGIDTDTANVIDVMLSGNLVLCDTQGDGMDMGNNQFAASNFVINGTGSSIVTNGTESRKTAHDDGGSGEAQFTAGAVPVGLNREV